MNMTKVFWSFPRRTAVPVFVGPKTFLIRILWSCSPMGIVRLSSPALWPRQRRKSKGAESRHALDLDTGPLGESRRRHGSACGRSLGEELRVDLVHLREIVHGREEDGRLHDVVHAEPLRAEDALQVLERALGLDLDA